MTVGRFFRTPKGTLLIVLAVVLAVAAASESAARVAADVGGAVVAAAVMDACILRVRKRRWVLPDGAVLSALIVWTVYLVTRGPERE